MTNERTRAQETQKRILEILQGGGSKPPQWVIGRVVESDDRAYTRDLVRAAINRLLDRGELELQGGRVRAAKRPPSPTP